MKDSKIRVLIVDDSSFMRSLLERMITVDERFEVIATAKDGAEGVQLAKALKPHIVTMDIEMPVMNGLDALRQIMEEDPRPVVMISSLTEAGAEATLEALELGAVDFLPKAMQDQEKNILKSGDILHEKLVAAVRVGLYMGNNKIAAPTPTHTEAPRTEELKKLHSAQIVIIGSSTGGPRALSTLLPILPPLSVPIVAAQHMPAQFTKTMAERLNDQSKMLVKEAENGEILEPGTIYIAPGGVHMRVNKVNNRLQANIQEDQGESLYKPSVQVLGKSVLESAGKEMIAVMLTGMGSDGADAFVDIHNAGGHVIAQDKASCVIYGMSRAVVERNAANDVLPLESIANKLVKLLS